MITLVEQVKNIVGVPVGRYQGAILYATCCFIVVLSLWALIKLVGWIMKF